MKRFFIAAVMSVSALLAAAAPSKASHADGIEAYQKNDFRKALREFKGCSDDARCMYMLGLMYEKGEGVKLDYTESAEWYRKGVEKDDQLCQYRLGRLYERGLGVEENLTEAIRMYKKSAQKNNSNAKQALKRLESK